MNWAMLLAAIIADDEEFNAGQQVTIPFKPLITKGGFKVELTPGSLNITLPSGQEIDTVLQGDKIDLPVLGETSISAGQDALLVQKAT